MPAQVLVSYVGGTEDENGEPMGEGGGARGEEHEKERGRGGEEERRRGGEEEEG